MRKLLLLVFLPLVAFTTFEWVTVKLDDHVSVVFPAQPVQQESAGNPLWMAVPDTNALFMSMVVDMEKLGVDSATLAPLLDQLEFYEQYREGAAGKFGETKLVYDTMYKKNGYHVNEFKLRKESTDLSFPYWNITIRSIFIGAKVYAFSYLEKNDRQEGMQRFFNSVQVK